MSARLRIIRIVLFLLTASSLSLGSVHPGDLSVRFPALGLAQSDWDGAQFFFLIALTVTLYIWIARKDYGYAALSIALAIVCATVFIVALPGPSFFGTLTWVAYMLGLCSLVALFFDFLDDHPGKNREQERRPG